MRYLLVLLFLTSFAAFGQEPIYTPMRLSYQFRGIRVDSLFLMPNFADTTAANSSTMKNVSGAMIRAVDDFWMRSDDKSHWIRVNGSASGGAVYDLTYSQLMTTISNKELVAGTIYRITDYRTEFSIFGTLVDTFGITEPLLVTAATDSTLDLDAKSTLYPLDKIQYTVGNIGQLKPNSGGKGTILFRHSLDSNLSAHYDWRAILWKRWAINPSPGVYVAFTTHNGINSFQYQKTFGTGCYNIALRPETYNVTIWNYCHSITLNGDIGIYTSGVTILDYCHDIFIDNNCCKVQTTGSGYIGGIYIGGSCEYINIGKRSYNIAIGAGAYAVDLGVQQSDVYIRPNIYRRRLEKGFSNFDVTASISSKEINLYNTVINTLGSLLYNNAQYCGIVNVTSTNAVDTLETLTALLTSVTFQPIELRPISNQKIVLVNTGNIELSSGDFTIDGSKGEYVILYKRMIDGLSTQPSKFYILNTNAIGGGQNFANADLTATGNRTHNFRYYNLTIDSVNILENRSYIGSPANSSYFKMEGNNVNLYSYTSGGKVSGVILDPAFNNVSLVNKNNLAYLSNRNFVEDTLAMLGDLTSLRKVDTIYRTAGKDSIFYKIAGTTYKIKDSTGGGVSGTTDFIPRFSSSSSINNSILKQNSLNNITLDGSAIGNGTSFTINSSTSNGADVQLTENGANRFSAGMNASKSYRIYSYGANADVISIPQNASRVLINSSVDDGSNTLQVAGNSKITGLAGTGTRMVVANSTGVLSTQTIPSNPSDSPDRINGTASADVNADMNYETLYILNADGIKVDNLKNDVGFDFTASAGFKVLNPDTIDLKATVVTRVWGTQSPDFQVGDFSDQDRIANVVINKGAADLDMSSADYIALVPGVFSIYTATTAYNFQFPDPTKWAGQMVILINKDVVNDSAITTPTGTIYESGSGNGYTKIFAGKMASFYSDGQNWYGLQLPQ